MSLFKALAGGFVGACVLSLLNESARQVIKDAPRLDILGKRAIALPLMKAGHAPPADKTLYWISMSSDLVANTLLYSLVSLGDEDKALQNGLLVGSAAGIGMVVLPKYLGLGADPSARSQQTELMTVAWYIAGGLAAATTSQMLSDNPK